MVEVSVNGTLVGEEQSLADASASIVMIYENSSGVRKNLGSALDTSTCFIETKDLDGGDVMRMKIFQKIITQIIGREEAPNLKLEVFYRNKLSEPLQYGGSWDIFEDDETPLRLPQAAYYRFRFRDDGISKIWKLARFTVFGELGGTRLS